MTGFRPAARPVSDLTLMHSSDIHVSEGYTEPVHAGDGTAGLRVVLEAARRWKADVALFAGDTFENHRVSDELVARAARLLAAAGMPVVILPGNHDPAIADSVYRRDVFASLAHIHVLGITDRDGVAFPDLGLEVRGRAHLDYGNMPPLGASPPRRLFWQVTMAHGHYDPAPAADPRLRPGWLFGDDEIDATDADYVALGHWNRAAQVGRGTIPAYYSGSPDHAGTVNLVRLAAGGAVTVERVPVKF